MNRTQNISIGYAPTRRNIFSREDALKFRMLILNKIKSFDYNIVDIDDINEEGLLLSDDDVSKTIIKFKNKEVDCIFSPHCNFGTESVVAKVAKEIGKPFLLWGPRDENPSPDGSRLRDTQCGLFATSKALQMLDVPFSYIVNSRLEDEIFDVGFNNFAKAVNVVKQFKKIKIGQIGLRPNAFWTVISNEGELLEKFGIEVIPFNLEDVIKDVKKLVNSPDDSFNNTYNYVKNNMDIEIPDGALKNIVALKEIMKSISMEHNISAFALQCWTSLQDMLGVVPCLANSLSFDERIPVACETDINGAITAVITQAAAFGSKPVFFADLTIRHPEDDNGELLWHCGSFPYSLRKKDNLTAEISNHFILEGNPPGICNWEIKGGDISITRFDGIKGNYSLLVGHAKGIEGPKTKGTYLWVKVKNWPKWEKKLIYGPYIHHVVGIHEKIIPILYEAIRYIQGLYLDIVESNDD